MNPTAHTAVYPSPVLPTRQPDVDIWSDDSGVQLIADVPGATAEGLSLRLESRVLHLEATAPDHRYQRSFHVTMDVDEDGLTAALKNGVLTVSLPRANREKGRTIPVIEA